MNKINLKAPLFAILAFICTISISCKSSSYTENKQGDEAVRDTVAQSDLNESQEDLMTVDYKQFYDQLAPHGEWIEVTAKDLKSEAPTSAGEDNDELNQILKDRSSTFQKVTLSQLFGVTDAVAADLNVGTFFVWKPDPSMAVSVINGNPSVTIGTPAIPPPVVVETPVYRPYTNGQWIASDEGWYFKAPTPQEEIVSHYGRWAQSPTLGWIWVPGRVRSPAWVDWREDDNNIAWTPIPPDVYIVNNVIQPVPVYEDNYVMVEKRYFVQPVVNQYIFVDKIKAKDMRRLNGLYVRDRVLYNRGPELVEIEKFTGQPIAPYQVVTMNNDFRNTWIENNRINTFAPVFYKVKGDKNKNFAVTRPEKFNKFEEVWNRENKSAGDKNKTENIGKQDGNENNNGKDSKEWKENKQEGKKKYIDDSDMKYGKKNKERKENAPKNENGNVNKEKKEKPNKDNSRKETIKERKENPKKEGNPKKDKNEVKPTIEKSKDSPKKDNSDAKPHGNPKKDK